MKKLKFPQRKKSKKSSIKTSMFVVFFIPVVVFTVISVSLTFYQAHVHQEDAIESQHSALVQIAYNLNNSIENFTNNMYVLESSPLFTTFTENTSPDYIFSPNEITNIVDTLSHIKLSNNLFYEIIVYNRQSDMVLTSNSMYKATEFFENFYHFESYPYGYWKNYENIGTVRILGNTRITSMGRYYTDYMPIVFSNSLTNRPECIVIGCVQKQALDEIFTLFNKISQAGIYMYDTGNNPVFEWEFTTYINSDETEKKLLLNAQTPIQTRIQGKKYFCISLNPQFPYFKNCTLLSAIPATALNEYSKNTLLISLWLILIAFMAACLIIIRQTKSFYSPIQEIIKSAVGTHSLRGNEFDILRTIYNDFQDTQKNLYDDMSKLLPIVCEQKTMQFLTGNSSMKPLEILKYLQKNNIHFNLKYFCIFLIKYDFTEKYTKVFNTQQSSFITYELENLLKITLPPEIKTYVLQYKKADRCVIANFSAPDKLGQLKKSLEEYIFNLSFDKDLLLVYIGISEVGDNFQAVQNLYTQADESIQNAQVSTISNLSCYTAQNQTVQYEYPATSERLIYNSLLAGDYDKAYSNKQSILAANQKLNLNNISLRALLYRFYLTASDILKVKKLDEKKCMRENYIDFNAVYHYYDISELNRYIDALYSFITSSSEKKSKIDKQKIIEYIQNNYNQDIYLERMAEDFDTSPKYISRIIKDLLGISFQQYLSSVRIGKAKELLLTTDMNIKEISETVGFNNQNTFLRSFERLEGVTPTTFRKNHSLQDKPNP